MTLIVACGLKREARIIERAGRDVVAMIGGGVSARLERALDEAVARVVRAENGHPGEGRDPVANGSKLGPGLRRGGSGKGKSGPLILSCGIAGALSLSLNPGDVTIDGDGEVVDYLRAALPRAMAGGIVGSDVIAATTVDKRTLAERTGGIAVDMETHVARRVAAKHGLPFGAIRVVSDRLEDDLPPAALVGMRPDGGMALGAVLASLARRPGQLPALIRTGRQANHAFRSLAEAMDAIHRAGIDRPKAEAIAAPKP